MLVASAIEGMDHEDAKPADVEARIEIREVVHSDRGKCRALDDIDRLLHIWLIVDWQLAEGLEPHVHCCEGVHAKGDQRWHG